MKKLIILLALVAGCDIAGDPRLGGARLECKNNCGVDITSDEVIDRYGAVINEACAYFKEDPGCINNWRIILVPDPLDHCITASSTLYSGCANLVNRTIHLWVGGRWCIEAQVLFHEVGHAHYFGGDPMHWAKAWWDHERMADIYFGLAQRARDLYDDWSCPACYEGRWSGDGTGPKICPVDAPSGSSAPGGNITPAPPR